MVNKVIYTAEDFQTVKKQLAQLASYLPGNFDNISVQLGPQAKAIDVDVLIIEDDVKHIVEYMKVLEGEKFSEVKNIIACTKSKVLTILEREINSFASIKLVILDFDLDEDMDSVNGSYTALRNYQLLCEKFAYNYDFRIIGITAFEGNYDVKDFRRVEREIRNTWKDLVLNKKFLDYPDLLANIFRNITALYERPSPSILTDQERPFNHLPPPAGKATIPDSKKLHAAKDLLVRLELGINLACPERSKFMVSKHYTFLKTKKGSSYSHYNVLTGQVESYSEEITYLLKNSDDQTFQGIKFQVMQYGLFSGQNIRL